MKHLILFAAFSLAACATTPRPTVTDWRVVATDNDRERLRDWRTAFVKALDQARAAVIRPKSSTKARCWSPTPHSARYLFPTAAINARVIKVGAKSKGMLDYIAYPAFDCRISQQGELQSFYKLTGSQRHTGLLYSADPMRQAFLGTLVLGDENRALQYGRDQERDLAGWVERVGDNRWRLILPYPHF